MTNELTQEMLKRILHYDPDTGIFTRLVSVSNNAQQSSVAGNKNPRGYRRIRIEGKEYLEHRLVWLYVHGYMPPHEIDHINRVRNDNRLSNLRLATRKINCTNTGMMSNNSSGVKGVTGSKSRKKWQAQIGANTKEKRRNIYIGTYDNLSDAKLAREIAEIFLWKNYDTSIDA